MELPPVIRLIYSPYIYTEFTQWDQFWLTCSTVKIRSVSDVYKRQTCIRDAKRLQLRITVQDEAGSEQTCTVSGVQDNACLLYTSRCV